MVKNVTVMMTTEDMIFLKFMTLNVNTVSKILAVYMEEKIETQFIEPVVAFLTGVFFLSLYRLGIDGHVYFFGRISFLIFFSRVWTKNVTIYDFW